MAIILLANRLLKYDTSNGTLIRTDGTRSVKLSNSEQALFNYLTDKPEAHSAAEIADTIHYDEDTVRSLVHSTRKKLKSVCGEYDSKEILQTGYYVPVVSVSPHVIDTYYKASTDEYNLDVGGNGDYKTVYLRYAECANEGYPPAVNAVGRMYLFGKFVEQDLSAAFTNFKQAADMGYASAQLNLAEMYLRGWGTDVNVKKAVEWLKKAADDGEGDGDAMYLLYLLYHENRIDGPKENAKREADYWKACARRKNVTSRADYMKKAEELLLRKQNG